MPIATVIVEANAKITMNCSCKAFPFVHLRYAVLHRYNFLHPSLIPKNRTLNNIDFIVRMLYKDMY